MTKVTYSELMFTKISMLAGISSDPSTTNPKINLHFKPYPNLKTCLHAPQPLPTLFLTDLKPYLNSPNHIFVIISDQCYIFRIHIYRELYFCWNLKTNLQHSSSLKTNIHSSKPYLYLAPNPHLNRPET